MFIHPTTGYRRSYEEKSEFLFRNNAWRKTVSHYCYGETRISSMKVETTDGVRLDDFVEEVQGAIDSKLLTPDEFLFDWSARYRYGNTFSIPDDDTIEVTFSGSLPAVNPYGYWTFSFERKRVGFATVSHLQSGDFDSVYGLGDVITMPVRPSNVYCRYLDWVYDVNTASFLLENLNGHPLCYNHSHQPLSEEWMKRFWPPST